jgi:hypothetical protein
MTEVKQDAVDFVQAKPNSAVYNALVTFEWDPTGMTTYTFPSENALYTQVSCLPLRPIPKVMWPFLQFLRANGKMQPLTGDLKQIAGSDMIAGPLPNRPGDGK